MTTVGPGRFRGRAAATRRSKKGKGETVTEYIKTEHAETERDLVSWKAEFQVAPSADDFAGMLHVGVYDEDSGEMVVGCELSRDQARTLWQAIGKWLDSE